MARDQKYPYLLILKGKHGNDYFHVTDQESLNEALGRIFDINDGNGYYDTEDQREYYEEIIAKNTEALTLLEPSVDNLPEPAKSDVKKHISNAKGNIAYAKESLAEIGILTRIRAGERKLAGRFVWNRRDSEYEYIEQEYYS